MSDPSTSLTTNITNLNNLLQDRYNSLSAAELRDEDVLKQQTDVSNILNKEYDRLSQKKTSVDLALTGQRRAATLNENYRERFAAYTKILIIFIFTIIIVLLINYFRQFIVFIPGFLIDFLIAVICAVSAIMCYLNYITILTRDDIYFNELKLQPPGIDISGNKTAAAGESTNLISSNFGMCIGSGCCDEVNTFWDSAAGVCTKTNPATTPTTPTTTTTTAAGFTTLDLAYNSGQISKVDYLKEPVKANTPIEFNDYAVYN